MKRGIISEYMQVQSGSPCNHSGFQCWGQKQLTNHACWHHKSNDTRALEVHPRLMSRFAKRAYLAKGPSANHFLRDDEDETVGVDGHGLLLEPRHDCVSQCIVVHKRVHRHGLASDGGNGVAPQRLLDGAAFIGAAVSADHGGLHDVLCDGAYEPIQRGAFHA